jgi:hypothetical protein
VIVLKFEPREVDVTIYTLRPHIERTHGKKRDPRKGKEKGGRKEEEKLKLQKLGSNCQPASFSGPTQILKIPTSDSVTKAS